MRIRDGSTLLVVEAEEGFRAPAKPEAVSEAHCFRRSPRPSQGVLTDGATLGLMIVWISPRTPEDARSLRDWGDFVHIRHIAAAGIPGFTQISVYENAAESDPGYMHFYEFDNADAEGTFSKMIDYVAPRLGGLDSPLYTEWADWRAPGGTALLLQYVHSPGRDDGPSHVARRVRDSVAGKHRTDGGSWTDSERVLPVPWCMSRRALLGGAVLTLASIAVALGGGAPRASAATVAPGQDHACIVGKPPSRHRLVRSDQSRPLVSERRSQRPGTAVVRRHLAHALQRHDADQSCPACEIRRRHCAEPRPPSVVDSQGHRRPTPPRPTSSAIRAGDFVVTYQTPNGLELPSKHGRLFAELVAPPCARHGLAHRMIDAALAFTSMASSWGSKRGRPSNTSRSPGRRRSPAHSVSWVGRTSSSTATPSRTTSS